MSKAVQVPTGWKQSKLIDIAPLQRGFDLPNSQLEEGPYPVVYSNGIRNYHSEFKTCGPGVITGRSGTIGKVTLVECDYWPHNTALWVTDFKGNFPKYIYYLILSLRFEKYLAGSGVPTLNRNDIHRIKTIYPPLPEQKAIAALLSTWDEAIEKTERLIQAKEKRFQLQLSELISIIEEEDSTEYVELGEILSYEQPTKYIVESSDYVEDGQTAVLTANKSFVLGYTNEETGIYTNFPVIIFDDFTTDSKFVDFSFKVKSSALKILKPMTDVDTLLVYWLITRINAPIGGHKRHWISEYQYNKVPLPEIALQKKLSQILENAQHEIDLLKQLADKYKTQKRGLMQRLLIGQWRITPDIVKTFEDEVL